MKKRAVFIIPVKHSSAVRDDWVAAALASEKRRGGSLFTLCNHTAFGVLVDVLLCLRLDACVRMCICPHVCTNYLRVHLRLWAAGWVCSLKRLCFCCHFFLPLSLCFILAFGFSFACGCIIRCLCPHPLPRIPLPVPYRN